ncbi:MAG TPA: HD domain-containing protein [Patescibacteria group bacterium]|nr:HD domain-containing protein [Patescibacteria group bacterium]
MSERDLNIDEANLHQFIHDVGSLKRKDRAGWIRHAVEQPESVAEHSFRAGIMAFVLAPSFGLDPNKCMKMAIFHDLGEHSIPDYTPFDNITREQKHREEEEAMRTLCSKIPNGDEVLGLWQEFEEGETAEAKLVRGIDRLEMMFQAEEYAREQPTKDLELFWEMSQESHFGELFSVYEALRIRRTITPSKKDV